MLKNVKNKVVACIIVVVIFAATYTFWKVFSDKFPKVAIVLLIVYLVYRFFAGIKAVNTKVNIEDLKEQGLTSEDIGNILFVKSWQNVTAGGRAKYVIIDGALFYCFSVGFVLFALIAFLFRPGVFSEGPGEVFAIIGYCLLVGGFAGLLINLLLWNRNESRFKRLTQLAQKAD